MGTRTIIIAAKIISAVFTPFCLPVVGLLTLFFFSYLSIMPWLYKVIVLGIVTFFTLLLPSGLIRLYRHYHGWNRIQLGQRERRAVPYVISICCYLACNYFMWRMHIPYFMRSVITMALLVQVVCAVVNNWWKISTHTAAVGAFASALLVFAGIFGINPVFWFCVVIIIAGLLGSSRMILRQHTLCQVVGGFVVGFICALVGAMI